MKRVSALALPYILISLAVLIGCTHSPLRSENPHPVCANVDWFEAGRSDGRMGYPETKLKEHEARCQGTENLVDVEAYSNGRETGLVEFCSPTGGVEAGRSGIPYEGVCPSHTEALFLTNYEIGRRIEQLENDNNELESRINNLVELVAPSSSANSMRAQIEQLRARRAQNNSEISNLESKISSDL